MTGRASELAGKTHRAALAIRSKQCLDSAAKETGNIRRHRGHGRAPFVVYGKTNADRLRPVTNAEPTKTSIVIRALNEAEHLPALFSGLLRQTRQPDQVILVDSGSDDDTVAIAEAHGADIIHIAPADFSFGRALNVGCEAATGDVLVFVSAHVYPTDEHWLANLIAPFHDAATALSYGRQTGDHRTKFSELQLLRQWFPDVSDPDQATPFCNNANCAVRRNWWTRHPYDENLTGLEDLAWAERALADGGRIAYRADATIVHIHEEDFSGIRNR